MKPAKINLVLSGGGARGIAHIGIIEVLEEHGFEIASVSGTSMGALVGGMYAAGALSSFKEWLLRTDIKGILRLLDFSLHRPGLIKGKKIMQRLAAMTPYRLIEELPVPFLAVATDLNAGQEVIFRRGELMPAIRASISIPTVFTPVEQENRLLVDGGLLNNIPVDHVPRNNLPVIAVCANAPISLTPEYKRLLRPLDANETGRYAAKLKAVRQYIGRHLHPHKPEKSEKHIGSYTRIINRSLHLMINRQSQSLLEQNPPDLLIGIPLETAGLLDFLKAGPIYRLGRQIALDTLAQHS